MHFKKMILQSVAMIGLTTPLLSGVVANAQSAPHSKAISAVIKAEHSITHQGLLDGYKIKPKNTKYVNNNEYNQAYVKGKAVSYVVTHYRYHPYDNSFDANKDDNVKVANTAYLKGIENGLHDRTTVNYHTQFENLAYDEGLSSAINILNEHADKDVATAIRHNKAKTAKQLDKMPVPYRRAYYLDFINLKHQFKNQKIMVMAGHIYGHSDVDFTKHNRKQFYPRLSILKIKSVLFADNGQIRYNIGHGQWVTGNKEFVMFVK